MTNDSIAKRLESAGFTIVEIMAIQSSILWTYEGSLEYNDNFKRLFGELCWDEIKNLRISIQD